MRSVIDALGDTRSEKPGRLHFIDYLHKEVFIKSVLSDA
jgi:hypothetical protein